MNIENANMTRTTIAEEIGGTVAKVAQAARLIRPVADKCMYSPECAIALAIELEETRERCAVAAALLEQALDDFNNHHGTGNYTRSPMERAEAAFGAGGAA